MSAISDPIPDHFKHYIQLTGDADLRTMASQQTDRDVEFYDSISEEDSMKKYAEDKWTIREVLQHLIDTERVFSYRVLALSRTDPNTLPGFDENLYVRTSDANNRSWDDLRNEFRAVRQSSLYLLKSLDDRRLRQRGPVSSYTISAGNMLRTMFGHVIHHTNIIKERYLVS